MYKFSENEFFFLISCFCSNSLLRSSLTMGLALCFLKRPWRLIWFSALKKLRNIISNSAANLELTGPLSLSCWFEWVSQMFVYRMINVSSCFLREFLLSCRGVGVRPPLVLSHSLVQFRSTAVGDRSTATLYLTNQHTHRNQSKEAATQLTKDVMAADGPRLFCFSLPKDSDISITPSAGRLLPGEVDYKILYVYV